MTEQPTTGPIHWSNAARDLVRSNLAARGAEVSRLVAKLVQESGNPRSACWKLIRRMGIQSQRPQRSWTVSEQQRLINLLDLYPVPEIAKMMRRSRSSIWHMLYRLGANAKMGKDSFTKYTLATALHVPTSKIEEWIRQGWLKARELECGSTKRIIIRAEDFCEFCRKHTRDVVGNRLSKERIDFVYHFVFPPSHAELLPVRESKRERGAFAERINERAQNPEVATRLSMEDGTDSIEEPA